MDRIREYMISVTAAAILCACIRSLFAEKNMTGKIIQLICGLFLSFTVVRPIADIHIQDFALFAADIQYRAREAAVSGEEFSRSAMADIIKNKTEAYILDKARALNVQIAVNVTVNEEVMLPQRVKISGSVSPYARQTLSAMIQEELGIPKEDQLWI